MAFGIPNLTEIRKLKFLTIQGLVRDHTSIGCLNHSYSILTFLKKNYFVFGVLHSCMGFSLVALSGGHFLALGHRLSIVVASLVAEHRL